MERLADLSLEELRQELDLQLQVRDAQLQEALTFDRDAFGGTSSQERAVKRQRVADAMEKLHVQNRDVVWPLEAEITRREHADGKAQD